MPFRSSLARSAGKLLGVFRERDLSLRGATQNSRLYVPPFEATGGTKIPAAASGNSYVYHVFLYGTSDNFVVNTQSGNVEVLIIGGGGGGSWSFYAGGGGAGGVVHGTTIPVTPGTYPITVGDKGLDSPPSFPNTAQHEGTNGGNSVFNGVTALGGGGGFGGNQVYPGSASGGSGGGGHGYPTSATASVVKDAQPVPGDFTAYGNPGGLGTPYAGGGGGGASAVGGSAVLRGPTPAPAYHHFGGLGGNGRAFPGFPGPIIAPAIPTTAIADVPVAVGGPGPAPERAAFTTAVGPTGLYGGGGGGGLYYTIGPDPSASGKPAGGVGGGADGAGSHPRTTPPQTWDIGPARKAVMHTGGGGGGGNYGGASYGTDGATGIVLVRYPSL